MLLLAGAALFTSCDKNIGKIEAIAEKFAISVNNKDKVDIYYINPICRTYKYMNLPTMLNTDGINVEFNEEDSNQCIRTITSGPIYCVSLMFTELIIFNSPNI